MQQLREYGQSPWLDGYPGADELRRLRDVHGIRGAKLADARDASEACRLLLPLWERTGGRHGLVSAPVDPGAREHPNLMVAIPATEPEAIEHSVAAGIPVDAVAVVSPADLDVAVGAYMRGIERLIEEGGDPPAVGAVASVPIAPVDAAADRRLEALGLQGLRGRLAIANARLAHRRLRDACDEPRWRALEARGATPLRCLWTGTSTAGTPYRDVLYAEELIGAGTIVALAPETIAAFEAHAVVADRLDRSIGEAARVVSELAAAGVDLEHVRRALTGHPTETRR